MYQFISMIQLISQWINKSVTQSMNESTDRWRSTQYINKSVNQWIHCSVILLIKTERNGTEQVDQWISRLNESVNESIDKWTDEWLHEIIHDHHRNITNTCNNFRSIIRTFSRPSTCRMETMYLVLCSTEWYILSLMISASEWQNNGHVLGTRLNVTLNKAMTHSIMTYTRLASYLNQRA